MATHKVSQLHRNSQQSTFLHILDTLPQPLLARAFPVHGKKPAVRGWQRPNPRPATIAGYRTRFADASGCGIRTGDGPGGPLVILDIDHPDQLTSYQADVLESWPWSVATVRGFHSYGAPPLAAVKTVRALAWGDFLASSSFAVAPGSIHPGGGRYVALPGFGQGTLPAFSPELLESLLSRPDPSLSLHPDNPFTGEKGDIGKPNDSAFLARLECAMQSAPVGQRNGALFAALRHWAYCQPQPDDPLEWSAIVGQRASLYASTLPTRVDFPDSELRKTARSVASWTWGESFRRPAVDGRMQAYRQLLGRESTRARNAGRDTHVLELRTAGLSYAAIARDAGLSKSTVYAVVKRGGQIAASTEELSRALSPGRIDTCNGSEG